MAALIPHLYQTHSQPNLSSPSTLGGATQQHYPLTSSSALGWRLAQPRGTWIYALATPFRTITARFPRHERSRETGPSLENVAPGRKRARNAVKEPSPRHCRKFDWLSFHRPWVTINGNRRHAESHDGAGYAAKFLPRGRRELDNTEACTALEYGAEWRGNGRDASREVTLDSAAPSRPRRHRFGPRCVYGRDLRPPTLMQPAPVPNGPHRLQALRFPKAQTCLRRAVPRS